MNQAYAKNGEIIAKNTARMKEIESVQSKLNTSTMLGTTASRAYTKEQVKLAAETKKAQRMNKLMTVGGGAMGALKSVGTMAGVGVGLFVVEQAISKLVEMKEKADDVRDATEGIGKVADSIKFSDEDQAKAIEEMGLSLEDTGRRMREVKKAADEVISSTAEFARTAQGSIDDANKSAIEAEYWSGKVIELSKNFDGSSRSLAELKNAVEQYNNVTGGNLKVVDDQTGRLNENTKAIQLNTDAYKAAVMVKAYTDVAGEAAKKSAEAAAQLEIQRKALEDLQAQHRKNPPKDQVEALTYIHDEEDLQKQIADLEKVQEENEKLAEVSFDAAESQRILANEEAEKVNKEREATKSASAYTKALKKAGEGADAFTQLGEKLGIPQEALDDFAASLAEDGIGVKQLAQVGTEAFARLYESAGGNIAGVNDLINSLNAAGIDPKNVSITEDGALEVKGHIIDLQNMTIDGKTFTVTADGVQGADEETNQLLQDVGILDDKTAEPNADLQDNASGKISSIASALSKLDGDSATVTVNEVTNKVTHTKTVDHGTEQAPKAAGGIDRNILRQIPRHADGMLTGRIVTQATMTNEGLVGEAGAEALLRYGNSTATVPLTNRRYVRPFARAVASEMPGGNISRTVNLSVNLAYNAGEDASRLAMDVASKLNAALEMEA